MNDSVSIITSLFIFLFPYIGKFRLTRQNLASLVVSLGILGTFGGIFWGLQSFDVEHTDVALPQLLEGLKTAFLTSISGMVASLILRTYPIFYGIKTEKKKEDNILENQMINALEAIETNTADLCNNFTEAYHKLNENLVSIITQQSHLQLNEITKSLQQITEQWNPEILNQLKETLQNLDNSIQSLTVPQEKNTEHFNQLYEELLKTLQGVNEGTQQLGLYLNKCVTMSNGQQTNMLQQMSNLGTLVKNTGENFEKQITNMEERFKHELSAMEQFTSLLLSIVKKLSQDQAFISQRKD